VLRAASEQYCRWLDAAYNPIRLAVNLSGRQLQQGELAETVARVLRETGMLASHLELEITESTIMRHDGPTKLALEELRNMGVGLALDDFGTGFSTLTHLSSFPVDRLKIDRSFISQIESRSQGADIASALIAMAHSLDLAVVAEGVETEGQADFLRRRGCDELQGYLLGRPVPATAFERFLDSTKPPQ
jgi:EAL domain-containing protein (putative c-di-GMP-specific phosphodiesterase class I)